MSDKPILTQRYGKTKVNVVKVLKPKSSAAQNIMDMTVSVLLDGDFARAYTEGDNRSVVPTDTCKNTVYYIAKTQEFSSPEEFGIKIAQRFLAHYAHVSTVTVDIVAHTWDRINTGHKSHPHPHSFKKNEEKRTCQVNASRSKTAILGGFSNINVLKTSASSFEDYHMCELTTLPPASDRIFATSVQSIWKHRPNERDFNGIFDTVKNITLNTFANEPSASVQHSLYRMCTQVLAATTVEDIRYSLPNNHVFVADMSRLGVQNAHGDGNAVYYPVDSPSGLIQAELTRSKAKM